MKAEASRYWPQIAALSDRPTSEHPFGLRTAVCERAAIKIYQAGLSPEQADKEALAETVPGWTGDLFDDWEET